MIAAWSKFAAIYTPPNSYIQSKMHPLQLKKIIFQTAYSGYGHNKAMICVLKTISIYKSRNVELFFMKIDTL